LALGDYGESTIPEPLGPVAGGEESAVLLSSTAYESFRMRLRALRVERGLTQSDLADRVGVSFSTISEIERGQRIDVPSRSFVVDLETALDLEQRDLLVAAGYAPEANLAALPESVREEVQAMFERWYDELQSTLDRYRQDTE
jgi:transcriptional regulator with XRE-family HTH domain